MRHTSLHIYIMNTWLKFETFILNDERDIHVKKMYMKKTNFRFS